MMTDEKITEVLDLYEKELPELWSGGQTREEQALDKVLDMIPSMRMFLQEGRREKLMRWLGFAQGILWNIGAYTLEELKDHNQPDEE